MVKRIFFTLISLSVAVLVQPLPVAAQSRSLLYDRYDVDIEVAADSTVIVTEKMDVVMNGKWRGVQRGILLENPRCTSDIARSGFNCGGFETIQLLEVTLDGRVLNSNEFEQGVEELEEDGPDYFVIRHQIWPGEGQFVTNQRVRWSVKYKLYGSLGVLRDKGMLLYWNVLPEDRGGRISKSHIEVTLPAGHNALRRNFNFYYTGTVSPQALRFLGNRFSFDLQDLPNNDEGATIEYLIDDGSVLQPAVLNTTVEFPWFVGLNKQLDGVPMQDIKTIPAGKHTLTFDYPGYLPQTFEVDAKAGGTVDLTVRLNPSVIMTLLLILNLFLLLVGLVLMIWLPVRAYRKWQREGRDQQRPGTVVPQFNPPANVRPYLAGSLRDEQVDPQDISGTIIDLAYRGFLKIREDKKKKYTLVKTDGSKPLQNGDDLDPIEQELMDALFGSLLEVEVDTLNTTFYAKSIKLQGQIYDRMVNLGYFAQSPQKTRQKYFGVAAGYIVLGVFLLIMSLTFAFLLLGVPGPFSLGLACLFAGIAWVSIAKYMPAKTPAGSKAYYDVEGFKMYMYRAERYRLQDLTPEEFERYLGYAVAFGIERQWAENFKDIYKGQPEWYEGTHIGFWDIYWTNRFLNSFTNSLNTNAFKPVQSGSGVSGSGWGSSGGGFGGGFSGGGGGGGFSGGF